MLTLLIWIVVYIILGFLYLIFLSGISEQGEAIDITHVSLWGLDLIERLFELIATLLYGLWRVFKR